MGRQSIERLRRPPAKFRLVKRLKHDRGRFESRAEAKVRDALREGVLQRAIDSGGLTEAECRSAMSLILYLKTKPRNRGWLSAASSVDMRKWRKRVTGWLWSLVDELDDSQWRSFTIVLPSWQVSSEELGRQRAKKLIARLRSALNRAGAKEAGGWLFAKIHGEFDGATNRFSLHVHGQATKGMFKLLKRKLRQQRQFRHHKGDRERYPLMAVKKRVVLQKLWGCAADPISYAVESYWPQHNSIVGPDGKRRRVGRKQQINDPVHKARYLMWLHAQPIKDQVLLMNLSVENGRLIHKRRGGRNRQT